MKTWQHASLFSLVNRSFKSHPLLPSPPSQPSNLSSPFASRVTKGLLLFSPASESYYSIQTHLHFFPLIVSRIPAVVNAFVKHSIIGHLFHKAWSKASLIRVADPAGILVITVIGKIYFFFFAKFST